MTPVGVRQHVLGTKIHVQKCRMDNYCDMSAPGEIIFRINRECIARELGDLELQLYQVDISLIKFD